MNISALTKNFHNLSVAKKLMGMIIATAILFIVSSWLNLSSVYKMSGVQNMNDGITRDLANIRLYTLEMVLAPDEKIRKETQSKLTEVLNNASAKSIPEFIDRSNLSSSDEKKVTEIFNRLMELNKVTVQAALDQKLEKAYVNTVGPELTQYETLRQIVSEQLGAVTKSTVSSVTVGVIVMIIVMFLTLVTGIYVILGIIGNIRKLSTMMADVAQGQGNLTTRLTVDSGDEIGQLAQGFNLFAEKIQQLIVKVKESAEQVAATSQELSSNADEATKSTQQVANSIQLVAGGSAEQSRTATDTSKVVEQVAQAIEQIASGAQEQSRNVLGTSTVVNDMTQKIDIMAEGMNTVKQISEQNGIVAAHGGKAVEKTVKGMLQVKEAVFGTAQSIHDLGEQSQKIGEIIQVIDDIAEQTNLLALNAAIEAARAGEHGKGFAVVADEVRKLAERSGKATKEIADLINNMQKGTKVAVESMEVGTREVEDGVNLAAEAGQALNEIVDGVKSAGDNVHKVMGLINDILRSSQEVAQAVDTVAAITEQNTAATQEMSASAEQVDSSMKNMAAISDKSASAAQEVSASTEELTASIEEMASSSEQLAGMAQQLRALVAQFQV